MKPFRIALPHTAALAFFLTAVFAVTAVDAPRPGKGSATVIFHNGTILTLDPAHPHIDAIAIGKGKILAMGSMSDVEQTRGKGTKLIDLHGNVLMPSLNDHHVHLLNIGLTLLNHQLHQALFLDLTKTRSEKEIAQLVAKRAASVPKGAWILGNGWSQNAWGQENLPTRKLLDRAAPDHPVYLIRVDGHCGWANETALRVAGITSQTPDPLFFNGKSTASDIKITSFIFHVPGNID